MKNLRSQYESRFESNFIHSHPVLICLKNYASKFPLFQLSGVKMVEMDNN